MEYGGSGPAGSGCALRLDPFALPVRFSATDAGADEQVRSVELDRQRVVVRRSVRGIPMAVKMPISAFMGVAMRVTAVTDDGEAHVSLSLEHADPGLCVPLTITDDSDDVIADWQSWAQVLGLPLLVAELNGTLGPAIPSIGDVVFRGVLARRRSRNSVKARRPSILMRRRAARMPQTPAVHREREIIARH
jgi:hypothetical protein